MSDLEFTGGVDFSEALSAVDDLAGTAQSRLEEAFSTAADQLTATLTAAAQDAFSEPVTVEADASAIAPEIDAALAGVQLELPIEANTTDATAEVAELVAGIDATPATIEVDADTTNAQAASDDLGNSIASTGTKAAGSKSQVASWGEGAALAGGSAALARGEVGGLGEVVTGSGLASATAVGGVAAFGASIFELYQKGVQATSAEERFNTILGETAAQVEHVNVGSLDTDLAKLGLTFGSTDAEVKNSAAGLFQFALNSGASREEAAGFTDNVAALSARAISLNPQLGSLSDVADLLGIRLSRGGRFAAAYGVSLTAADINARALDNTHKTAATDLTIYEKAQAAVQLSVEKYGTTLGDVVAKGAKNAAVEQRSLRAELDQLLESAGKPLVAPIFEAIKAALPDVLAIAEPLARIGVSVLPAIADAASLAAPLLRLVASAIHEVPEPVLAIAAAGVILNTVLSALGTKLAVTAAEETGLAVAASEAAAAETAQAAASTEAAAGQGAAAATGAALTANTVSLGGALLVAGAGVASFKAETWLLNEAWDLSGAKGQTLEARIHAVGDAAKDVAGPVDGMVARFNEVVRAQSNADVLGPSTLVTQLEAFKAVAKDDLGVAAQLAEQFPKNSTLYAGMAKILGDLVGKQKDSASAGDDQAAALQHVTGIVDTTTAAFKAGVAEFGDWAGISRIIGVTDADLGTLAQHAADLDKSTSSAFTSATSVVQKYASDTGAATVDIIGYLNQQVTAATQWSNDLKSLAAAGLDQGLIEQLRQAGPKAEPLIQGFLSAVASGNLQAINDAQAALTNILGDTNKTLDAAELHAAIKAKETAEVITAAYADAKDGGTKNLDALRASSDAELAQMATDAETNMGRVGAAINSVPKDPTITPHVDIDGALANVHALLDEIARIPQTPVGVPGLGGNPQPAGTFGPSASDQFLAAIAYANAHPRAAGGPVDAGMPYLVNENTPRSEIFVPKVAGTIYSQSQWGPAPGGASAAGARSGGEGAIHIDKVVLEQASPNPVRETMSAARQLRAAARAVVPV